MITKVDFQVPVLVESQIQGYPKRAGVALEMSKDGSTVLVEFKGERLWCEVSTVEVDETRRKVQYS